jgi:hypothetical protein
MPVDSMSMNQGYWSSEAIGAGSGISEATARAAAQEEAEQWTATGETPGVMLRYRSNYADRTIGRDLHEDVRRFAL